MAKIKKTIDDLSPNELENILEKIKNGSGGTNRPGTPFNKERNVEIYKEIVIEGKTQTEVAKKHDLSQQRIRPIIDNTKKVIERFL